MHVYNLGFSQCFTDKSCTGDTVPAATERECCVDTNEGLAFADGGACTACIGNYQCLYRYLIFFFFFFFFFFQITDYKDTRKTN